MKTASDLGITEERLAALIKVRDMLSGGELTKCERIRPAANGFNMDATFDVHACGTVGCIGGWMAAFEKIGDAALGAVSPSDEVAIQKVVKREASVLLRLFYPNMDAGGRYHIRYSLISAASAVAAINNVLEHGEPLWVSVLRERQPEALQ